MRQKNKKKKETKKESKTQKKKVSKSGYGKKKNTIMEIESTMGVRSKKKSKFLDIRPVEKKGVRDVKIARTWNLPNGRIFVQYEDGKREVVLSQ